MDNKNNNKNNNMEFNQLLDYLKRKDINNYTDKELELLTELFKKSGYNINFLKFKDNSK